MYNLSSGYQLNVNVFTGVPVTFLVYIHVRNNTEIRLKNVLIFSKMSCFFCFFLMIIHLCPD